MPTASTTKGFPAGRAVAAALIALALAGPGPVTGAGARPAATGRRTPARTGRPATGVLPARVLAASAIIRPAGVAVAADGEILVSETEARRLYRVFPGGGRAIVPVDLEAPAGLALEGDGTLHIADGRRIVTIGPKGGVSTLDLPGRAAVDAVGVDASGALYATDPIGRKVFRADPDGEIATLSFTGVTEPRGIDVTADGTVSVIDGATRTVVRRAADATETTVSFSGLEVPTSLDVEGDRILVGDDRAEAAPTVVLREADGTETTPFPVAQPGQVVLQADGTIVAADTGRTGCRCPEPPGRVVRLASGGTPTAIDIGDIGLVGSLAAAGPGTVLFTSWHGAPGYSDPNPLRQVVADGPATDLATGGEHVTSVDAAPDGTAYVRVADADARGTRILRRPAGGGALTEVALPPGGDTPAVIGLSVDQAGRLFVARGTGYGTGPFEILEPLAPGGPKTWYRDDAGNDVLQALAAGGGRVYAVLTSQGAAATSRLVAITSDGHLATVRTIPNGAFAGMDADGAGNVYLLATSGAKASTTAISVIRPDGTTGTLTYRDAGPPTAVSVGTDGTLYVGDAEQGVVAIDDVGAVAGVDGPTPPPGPAPAPPAVPVSGSAGFTG